MVDKDKLTDFYIAQYQADVQKKRNKNLKVRDAQERLSRLRHALRTVNPSRLGMNALEDYHKQIRNLY